MLIKEIRDIMNREKENGYPLKIDILPEEIIFTLYDSEIPIVYNTQCDKVNLEAGYLDGSISEPSFLHEIADIMEVIQTNTEEIKSWL